MAESEDGNRNQSHRGETIVFINTEGEGHPLSHQSGFWGTDFQGNNSTHLKTRCQKKMHEGTDCFAEQRRVFMPRT